jgi:heterodisulfide reductase subunit A2
VTDRRLGVYVCHCGGNISDYVDVEAVREGIVAEDGVVVHATTLFACSDAAQQQMAADIVDKKLDGLVVASCSPQLHTATFRGVADRAGLNPHQYVQVNVREQCSWTHRDDTPAATAKATRLVRAGIAMAARTRPLEPLRVETVPSVLVVGAGVAGLRAALALADLGLAVHVVERDAQAGGRIAALDALYPSDRSGRALVDGLLRRIDAHERVTLFTGARLLRKAGGLGDFEVEIGVGDQVVPLRVGAIIVATGFDPYQPVEGELGRGLPGVLTLPEFRELLAASDGSLSLEGRDVERIAYVYCVGSRQPEGNTGCSRYCCNAAVHTANLVSGRHEGVQQFHVHRGMRTYGKHELLFEDSCRSGSVFFKVADDAPPRIEQRDGGLTLTLTDLLTDRSQLELEVDLVVLVTGMVPRENAALSEVLKIPTGQDGFWNEIHPKLRPVETVIDGVFIAGSSQGPKTTAESVASSMAASAKVAGLLKRGFVELAPLVASVDPDLCTWCDACSAVCDYGAIGRTDHAGRATAVISMTLCKGGGACLPVCPHNAIQLEGHSDDQVESMISAMAREVRL